MEIFVNNQVNIKQENGDNVVVFQKVNMINEPDAHTFEFTGEFNNEDGTDKVQESIFSVDEMIGGSYAINFNKLDIFKNDEGKTLADMLPIVDGVATLTMYPGEAAISMSSNGEELVFNFKGTDGKDYQIKTGSLGISVEYDGKQYNYSTNQDSAVGVNLAPKTLEAFLDKNNTIFKTPKNITKEIPSYMIGLYGSLLRGNSQQEFGDFTITSINAGDDDDSIQPYIFVTKTKEDSTTSNFLYVDGVLKKCNNFLLQYQARDGFEPSPAIVLEVSSSSAKKGVLPNPKYYGIPAIINENGKISENSKQAIELLYNIASIKENKGMGEVPFVLEGEGDASKYNFFKKDERAYSKYTFRIKNKSVTKEADKNKEDSDDNSDEEENDYQSASSTAQPFVGGDEKEETKEVNISKYVETFSSGGCFLGLALMIISVALGMAPLAIVGFGVILAGTTGVACAEFFKYEIPVRKAKQKISEYEKQEIEDAKFSENFNAQDKSLEQNQELSEEKEASLSELLHADSALMAFTEAYNVYGVGFEGMLDGEERVNALIGFDGYERKVAMAETLNQISKAKKPEQRTQFINQFIHQNFEALPAEKEQEVRKIFNAPNKDVFNQFVRAMNNTVSAQKTEKKVFDAQVKELAEAKDSKLIKTVCSENKNSAQRKAFFERYSNAIVRHFITSDKATEESIGKVVEKLPYEDKTVALEILNGELDKIGKAISNVTVLANDNRQKVHKAQECSRFIETVIKLDKTNTSSYAKVKDKTRDFIVSITAKAHKPNEKDEKAVLGIIENVNALKNKTPVKLQKEIASQIIEILNMEKYPPVEIAYKSIIETAEKEGLLEAIVDHYVNNTSVGQILPDLSKVKTSKEYTLEALAEKLGNDNLKEKLRLYNESRREQIKNMNNKMGELVENLEQLDASVGFVPNIDSIEVNEELKKMKRSNTYLNELDPELQKRIAVARIKAKDIETATAKDKLSEDVIDLYGEFDKMTNLTITGRLTQLAVDKAVKSSLEIETDIATKTLKIQAQELKTNLENYNTTLKVVDDFAKDDEELKKRTENVIKVFKAADLEKDEKRLLKEAFKEEFGVEFMDPTLTFKEVIEKLTAEGKIDPAKVKEFINDHIEEINEHTKTNLHTMDNIIGEEFIDDEYNRRKKEAEKGEAEEERYSSSIEILTKRFGLDEEKIRQEVANGKTTVEALLKKFGIKEKEYSKYSDKIRESGYSDQAQLEIWEKEYYIENLQQQCQDFDNAWENAVCGDSTGLKEIIENKKYTSTIKKLGIDTKSIIKILKQDTTDAEKASLLDNLDQKQYVTSRSNRILKVEKDELERFKEINESPTKGDKDLFIARKRQEDFEKNRKEFFSKVNAILKKGIKEYSEAQVDEAFKAFVNGDINYFLAHPEIKCEGDFDFSENDPILLSKLGIKPKQLTVKAKKRGSNLIYIDKDFMKKSKDFENAVKEKEKQLENEENKGSIDLNKVSEAKVKDRVSIFTKIFSNITEKHKKNPPKDKEDENVDEYENKEDRENDSDEAALDL